jgi:hypothetical protein
MTQQLTATFGEDSSGRPVAVLSGVPSEVYAGPDLDALARTFKQVRIDLDSGAKGIKCYPEDL